MENLEQFISLLRADADRCTALLAEVNAIVLAAEDAARALG